MRRWLLFFLAAYAVAYLFPVNTYSQEDMMVVDNEAFGNPKRPPAVFRHDAHSELAQVEECNVCHHVYEDGKLIESESSEDQRCADCHELQDIGRKPGLMKAFHYHCKGCHRGKMKGPLMCGQCHLRQ